MNKMRTLVIGLTLVSLLAVGVVALAGNGFGNSEANPTQQHSGSGSCALNGRDADGDGITNSEDPDWAPPADGSGYGRRQGSRRSFSASQPQDGTGYRTRQGGGQGQRSCSGDCSGSCL